MTVSGIDYAWQHPNPAAIKAAGYDFACRYLSHDPTKNLTLTEAEALKAAGVWVVANWEYGAQDALRGFAGGVADAQLALAQALAAGMPPGRPIYFSRDWDVTPAQEATVTDYDRGADSVLGAARVGDYGGYYPLKVQRDAGVSTWSWQTTAWSGGQWDARDQIRQTGAASVGGVQVDVNEALTPDFGQWMPGIDPTIQEADMTPEEHGMLLNVNAAIFAGGTDTGETPPGAPSNAIVHKLDYLMDAVRALQAPDPVALAAALAANPDAVTKFASALAAVLPAAATADQIAAAVARHLGTDLGAG